jgi:3-hydroxyisobutyrate dehydrogenase-like beta-hydroxyacid dehydrogenase
MSEKVAVIGMGQMGSGMAGRLRESNVDVVGYDISPDQSARLSSEGFRMTSSIAEALAGRTLVLTSLPDPKSVTSAWLGADGIVANAAKGTLCIELSTIDPQTMRQVAEAAAARGISVVDCPVSGSPKEARAGKLVVIAGGAQEDVARAEPIFKLLGTEWKYTGGVGTAKVVKIVNNMMSMGNVLVAAEAFALGVAAGVEPQKLYDVLSVSGGRSHHQALSQCAEGRFLARLQDGARREGPGARRRARTHDAHADPIRFDGPRALRARADARVSRPGHRVAAEDVRELGEASLTGQPFNSTMMFPDTSNVARAPSGTTSVEDASSTMTGPMSS